MTQSKMETQAAITRRAKVARLTTKKAGSASSISQVTVEDVLTAAKFGDLPTALFFVAMASDEVFDKVRRAASLALIDGKPGAVTLVDAVALSRRLQNQRPV